MTGKSVGLTPFRICPVYTPTWRYRSGNQAAGYDIAASFVNRRYLVARGQSHDTLALTVEERITGYEKGLHCVLSKGCEGSIKLAFRPNSQDLQLPPNCTCGGLHVAELAINFWAVRIRDDRDPAGRWHQFVQEPKALRFDCCDQIVYSRRISARLGKAGNETQLDRVHPTDENDWDGVCRRLDRKRGHRTARRSNYGDLAHYQISSQTWELLIAIFRPAILYGDVLMFDISGSC